MIKKFILFFVVYGLWVLVLCLLFVAALTNTINSHSSPLALLIVVVPLGIIFIGAPIFLFVWMLVRPPKWQAEVLSSGKTAPALVLDLRDSMMRIGTADGTGRMPYYRLKLRVQPSDETPFEADLEKPLSAVFFARPGTMIQVMYDPANKQHVVIPQDGAKGAGKALFISRPAFYQRRSGGVSAEMRAFLGGPAQNSSGLSATSGNLDLQAAALTEMRQRGLLTDAQYEAAKSALRS